MKIVLFLVTLFSSFLLSAQEKIPSSQKSTCEFSIGFGKNESLAVHHAQSAAWIKGRITIGEIEEFSNYSSEVEKIKTLNINSSWQNSNNELVSLEFILHTNNRFTSLHMVIGDDIVVFRHETPIWENVSKNQIKLIYKEVPEDIICLYIQF